MENKPRLLAIFAHPDDETFGAGGTLARYAQSGVEVKLVCATRGEAGEVEERYLQGYTSIAELRTAELNCAARALGLREVIFLGYRDSGMPGSAANREPQALINAPLEKLTGDLVGIIRRFRPQVVITHDPNGGYGHPDHIHLQRAVEKAFLAAGDPAAYPENGPVYAPQKLYYNTISRTVLRWLVRLMPLFGKDPARYGQNRDIDLRAIVAGDAPLGARINFSKVAAARKAASDCYASQGGQQANRGMAGLLRGWARSHEVYLRAYPAEVAGGIETDLYTGVEGER